MTVFIEKNQDQIREAINTAQRFQVFSEAKRRVDGYRGSMSFADRAGQDYLLKDYYDPANGVRRQVSLGKRSPETERLHLEFHAGREEARERFAAAGAVLDRQAGINRSLGLGRVPETGARIIRALDAANLLGRGLRIVGTHALYAYEADTAVFLPTEAMTTEDIDILLDSRVNMRLLIDDPDMERSLMGVLQKADRSFRRNRKGFQAENREGYLVDLIQPMRDPPWLARPSGLGASTEDLAPTEIEGLLWHENVPAFEAVAIDARGYPVRIVAPDPRAFAVHKHWLAQRADRQGLKRSRDLLQARLAARLVADHMPHLPFDPSALKAFPRAVVDGAAPLFERTEGADPFRF